MSTRCRIGVLQDNGTIRSIYCHFDGYPKGVGRELLDNYTDIETINKLLDLGDISCLGNEPVSDPKDWDPFTRIHKYDYTLAYRDRGEDCPAEISKYENAYYELADGCDYAYLFHPEEKVWKFCSLYKPMKYNLKDFLEEKQS